MQIRESICIHADASTVWRFVADPELQRLRNPKVVSVQRHQSQPVTFGEQFAMDYRMSGKERPTQVQVQKCEPPNRVVFQHRIASNGQEQTAQETYEISTGRDGVEVVQTIDLSGVKIAWPLRALIWFITRFGKSVEQPYLERLKQVVEQRNVPAA